MKIRPSAFQCRVRQMKGWTFRGLSKEEEEATRKYIETGDASDMVNKPDPIVTEDNYKQTIYYY